MTDFINKTNPESGFMSEPSDPREVEACHCATRKSLETFPYFFLRFGERGERFTYTDSGFIVTLVTRPAQHVISQIMWLGKMLSNRGIPQYLLERHLNFLNAELVSHLPEKYNKNNILNDAAEHLKSMRINIIPEKVTHHLNQNFNNEIGQMWSHRMYGCGMIIISAVADEKMEIKNAVKSVFEWMTDATRFPKEWVDAARQLFKESYSYANRV